MQVPKNFPHPLLQQNWPKPNVSSEFLNAFKFEIFDVPTVCYWMVTFRPAILLTVVCYLLGIFIGQRLMKHKEPFNLRPVLLFWNTFLALLSLIGLSRTFPETFYNLKQGDGIHKSLCTYDIHNFATGFWALVFTLSKVVELGDTAFIVLRKQPLIFLHWYHHITVLLLSWLSHESYDPGFRCFGPMNYFVHLCMYTYYAFKSQKIAVPKEFAMALTAMQIIQMIVGFVASIYSLYMLLSGSICHRRLEIVLFGLLVYVTYFVLFLNYFVQTYFLRRTKIKNT